MAYKFKLCITGDIGFEFWKDIPGYEGRYQASIYGRIRSLNYNKTRKVRVLNIDICRKYQMIELAGKRYLVHRLIASTFIPKWNKEDVQVNHKDENKSNNRVENLEFCTAKYNSNYGRQEQYHKDTSNRSRKEIIINGDCFKSQEEAAGHYNVSCALISMYVNGKIKNSRKLSNR